MKMFSWMHSKLKGKEDIKEDTQDTFKTKTANTWPDSQIEEFSDWPHGLLTIGTFGNNTLKPKSEISYHEENQSINNDQIQDITTEEMHEVEKEIAQLLDKEQVDESLNEQSPQPGSVSKDDYRKLESCDGVVLSREKEVKSGKKKGYIRKRSLNFILKKILVCRSGFDPAPSLRDPTPDKSRMEKILRAILHKKIYPQSSNRKKCLETNQIQHNSDSDDEIILEAETDGSKWDKTDSDYIVLEI